MSAKGTGKGARKKTFGGENGIRLGRRHGVSGRVESFPTKRFTEQEKLG